MNDEIKEILDSVRKCCDITKDQSFVVYQRQDILKLLDYITNLQQELETTKINYDTINEDIAHIGKLMGLPEHFIITEHMYDWVTNIKRENERLNYQLELQNELTERNRLRKHCYKSRIEKAVEYIENTSLYETTYDYNMEEELEIQNVSDETASNKLLNILNGRSDE